MINPSQNHVFGKDFFELHQDIILRFINTKIGRLFFRIHGKNSSSIGHKITKVAPNYIEWNGKKEGQKVAEFRTNNKFSKRLYYGLYPIWWLMHQWDILLANNFAPQYNLGFDTLTVYPDADPETNTVDGYPYVFYGAGSGLDWSVLRVDDGSTGGAFDDNPIQLFLAYILADTTTNKFRGLRRGIFLFDTSSLTSGAIISSAVVSIYGKSKADGASNSPQIGIYSSNPASNTSLVGTDLDSIGSTLLSSIINYADYSTSGYNDFTLNATGLSQVSKTSITKLGSREVKYDADGATPTWSSGSEMKFEAYPAETSGTTSDPKLVVTYSTGSNTNSEIQAKTIGQETANSEISSFLAGGDGRYVEDFSTTTKKDAGNTTASWTGDGTAEMS